MTGTNIAEFKTKKPLLSQGFMINKVKVIVF
jgi:hypothetical protein